MTIRAQSIDYAVGGFLRHRFLRSVAAAGAILLVFALLTVGVIFAIPMAASSEYTSLEELGAAAIYAAAGAGVIALYIWQGWPRQSAFFRALMSDARARKWRAVRMRVALAVGAALALMIGAVAVVANVVSIAKVLLIAAVILAIVVLGLFVCVLAVAALLTLVYGLYRRGLALIGLVVFGSAVTWFAYSTAQKLMSSDVGASDYLLASGGVIATLISIEFLGQSWWQFTASKAGFYAVRGWRPPMQRLFTTARRHLGLPAFIANFGRQRWRLSGLYLAATLCNAIVLAMIFSPVVVGIFAWTNDIVLISVGMILAVVVAAACYLAGSKLARMAAQHATDTYQSVREWDQRPPVVFLRSFEQDARKLKARSIDPLLHFVAGVARPQTLDEILIEHATPYGPVIAIGDPRGAPPQLGAARIFVPGDGNEWQDVVNGLVTSAKAIVMCPTTSEGVRWELNLLERHDLALRAIYLANPEISEGENLALFQQLSAGLDLVIPRGKIPIAAFHDDEKGWRVLATRKRSLQSYTVALNFALQTLHGVKATPPVKRPRVKKVKAAATPTPAPQPAEPPAAAA